MKIIAAFLFAIFGFAAEVEAAPGYQYNCHLAYTSNGVGSRCFNIDRNTAFYGYSRADAVCQKWGGWYWIYKDVHGEWVKVNTLSYAACPPGYKPTPGSAETRRL